ncbi:MAG TPA: ester cyclase [Nitrososphaera sp.]|jgi:predicted SnoaL-like aldol condensation-catalyzing enzyme|nr:ester cyclase [Nitrososphaera sp.]
MSAVDKYYAQDLIQPNPQVRDGSEGFKQFFGPFFEGFPDSHTTIEHMIAEDNLVMAFLNNTATQTGEYLGAPPTNKTIVMITADLFRIEDGMMIVEHRDVVLIL